ncbi:Glucan endo-1,3-beta-glucosidase 1 [Camellia lanceoleosa]|nr:Glucan endo-1,3-beta-glucosidase 1 [Camellia lanceoleosa]
MMAQGASNYLFLCLLFVLTVCSSGTVVGFFYDAKKLNAISSPTETVSYLKVYPSQVRVFVADHRALNSLSNTGVLVDLYLNQTLLENLRNSEPHTVSCFKTLLTTFLPHVNIKITGKNDIPMLLSTLKSIHSEVKASVSFSLDLNKVLNFIKKIRSFVVVEATVDGELSINDKFIESLMKRATSVCSDVSIVLKSRALLFLITGLFAEVSLPKELEKKEQVFGNSHRELLAISQSKTTQHDTIYPPATPVTVSPNNNPTPIIVTIPSTNPVTVNPDPTATPVTVPSTTPVPVPSSTNPVNSPPVPITNPVTTPGTVPGAQPITNPVTTYPAPSTGVPVTTPVTNPVAPPATTGAPTVSGQNWCVAKSGVSETALQVALDYACGIGGADCSAIQEGASCYNPVTLQNHASYAFNSYYQKKPVQTSCDFGGTAMLTNNNPSTSTCIYPSSSSPTSSPTTATPPTTPTPTTPTTPTPTTPTPTTPTTTTPTTPTIPAPTTPMTPTPSTTSSSGATTPGYGSPPAVLNMSNPASGSTTVFGESPPTLNSSTSMATGLQPFTGYIILITSIVAGRFILDMLEP